MNKLFKFYVLGILGILALPAFADNAVEMVTYFPVPYASYGNVFTSQKFDVGTKTGNPGFTLNLGNNTCNPAHSLKAGDVNLVKVNNNQSALDFGTDIFTSTATFGSTSTLSNITLNFSNLRVDTLTQSKDFPAQTIEASSFTVNGNMYMFDDKFVSNGAALPGSCDKPVTWQSLTINTKTGYYLVCGDGTSSGSGECSSWIWSEEPNEYAYCDGGVPGTCNNAKDGPGDGTCWDGTRENGTPQHNGTGHIGTNPYQQCNNPTDGNDFCYVGCTFNNQSDNCKCKKYTAVCKPDNSGEFGNLGECEWVLNENELPCRMNLTAYCMSSAQQVMEHCNLKNSFAECGEPTVNSSMCSVKTSRNPGNIDCKHSGINNTLVTVAFYQNYETTCHSLHP